jgi:hypothetical protein
MAKDKQPANKQPVGKPPIRPVATTEINLTFNEIVRQGGGETDKALLNFAVPWHKLMFGLQDPDAPVIFRPANPPPEIVGKTIDRIEKALMAYQSKLSNAEDQLALTKSSLASLQTQYCSEKDDLQKRLGEALGQNNKIADALTNKESALTTALSQKDAIKMDLSKNMKELADVILQKDLLEKDLGVKSKELGDLHAKYGKALVDYAAKEKELADASAKRDVAENSLAVKTQELADITVQKDSSDKILTDKLKELSDAITQRDESVKTLSEKSETLRRTTDAKDTAERTFATIKQDYEVSTNNYGKLQKVLGEINSKLTVSIARIEELDIENMTLYDDVSGLQKRLGDLKILLESERKNSASLEKSLERNDKDLSMARLRVRSGWYASAAAALIGVVGYIGWLQSDRPNITQIVQAPVKPELAKADSPKVESPKVEPKLVPPPKVDPPKVVPPKVEPPKVEPKPVAPAYLAEPRNESMRYVMGAYLLEFPDNQFVISSKKDAELEKSAKSVSYLPSAYVVEIDKKLFALTDDRKSLLEKSVKDEKSKLGRDLRVDEKKLLYEKFAARFVSQ